MPVMGILDETLPTHRAYKYGLPGTYRARSPLGKRGIGVKRERDSFIIRNYQGHNDNRQ